MKKTLAMLLCGAMTMALLVGCGNGSADATQTTAEETEATTEATESTDETEATETTEETEATEEANPESDRTTFVVGFDAEYPPYGYMDDNGEYTGFDLELAQAVCDMEGWELTKTPIDWDSKDMELNSGSIDCIWNGFTINGREDDYTWSDPYSISAPNHDKEINQSKSKRYQKRPYANILFASCILAHSPKYYRK